MGQQCSTLTCRQVENPEAAEMSRVDSPDPVMYDLMRKSIQATHAMWSNNNNSDGNNGQDGSFAAEISSITKSGNNKHSHRIVGQSHLLFKNNNNNGNNVMMMTNKGGAAVHGGSTRVSIPRKNHASFGEPMSPTKTSSMAEKKSHKLTPRRGMESRSGGKMGSVTKASTDGPSSSNISGTAKECPTTTVSEELLPPLSSQSHLKCPTRLLIRRRSLRVVEEGGGTHIYAIRYPEDTSQMILSEQAVPFSSVVRQEQCPTRVPPPSTTTTHIVPTPGSSLTPTSGTSRSTKQSSCDSNSNPHSPSTKSLQASSTTTGAVTPSSSEPQPKRVISDPSLMPSATAVQGPSVSFPLTQENVGEMFAADCMAAPPRQNVLEWVTVSDEHKIYVADVGLTPAQCDELVATTEQVCRGQYAAYTYAKQTLGCREFPVLAHASLGPVHTVVHAITSKFPMASPTNQEQNDGGRSDDKDDKSDANGSLPSSKEKNVPMGPDSPSHHLQLDDREPHIVKYDVTRKERQKLDMHTDKSEWTFLIALSNGCGVDYEGGGTYFECLDATVHIQRGHALVFPGKLRHCGQKITSGLRFLLVGFLVDKQTTTASGKSGASGKSTSSKTQPNAMVRDSPTASTAPISSTDAPKRVCPLAT